MTSIFNSTLLICVLFSSAFSQNLMYSKKVSQNAIVFMQAIDVNDIQYDGYASSYKYQGFIRNDSLTVFELTSGVNDSYQKLPQIDLSQTTKICYAYAFKNLFQDDNQWSIVLYYYNASNITTLAIYTNGSQKFIKTSTSMPSWFKLNGSFYMSTTSSIDTVMSLYSFRNNLASLISNQPRSLESAGLIKNGNQYIAMIPVKSGNIIKWQLYQVNGETVKSTTERVNGEIALLKVDLSNLSNGTYIFKADTETNSYMNILSK